MKPSSTMSFAKKPPKKPKVPTYGQIDDLKSDVRKKYKKIRKSIDMDPKTNQNFKQKMRL